MDCYKMLCDIIEARHLPLISLIQHGDISHKFSKYKYLN